MYQLTQLPSGIKVVSGLMQGRQSIGIGVWAKVGARFENKKNSGISHCLEHMLFKGTKHRSTRKIKEDVEGVGGVMNAFTSEESTCYFVKITNEHQEQAFDVLADMVNHASLKAAEFAREKTVILEEIKMYLDLPSHQVHELINELMWPEQPLGRPIAGTESSVTGIQAQDLKRYMGLYYKPQNLVVSFCGQSPHDEVCDWVKDRFQHKGAFRAQSFLKAESSQKKPRFHLLNKKTEQMHFVIGFHGLYKNHPHRYQLGVLNVILGANMSSRLFEEVREKRGLAYEIKSGLAFFEDTGAVGISAGVEPKKAALATRVIMRELKRLKQTLVSRDELRRAKDYYIGQLRMGLEDTLDHMLWIGERCLYRNELPDQNKIIQEIEAVSADDVQILAKRLFRTKGVNLALIGQFDKSFEKQMQQECDCD